MIKKLSGSTAIICAILLSNNSAAQEIDINEKISVLEKRIKELETINQTSDKTSLSSFGLGKFTPDISLILNGAYKTFSRDHTHIRGFQVGHEGEKGDEGFSLGESELNVSANVDDKFFGNLTIAIADEDGEDKIHIEEAFFRTTALPYGTVLTAGRMLPVFGYLNDKHLHTDFFADRPLPYRVFFNNHFNDDGVQLSIILPTDFYSEIGSGVFRGKGFPADSEGSSNIGSYTAFAKIGSDIGVSHAWMLGASYLHAKSKNEGREDNHGHNHGTMVFDGKNDFYGIDLKYTFSPNGNNKNREFILQGEYIYRKERGQYDTGSGFYDFDSAVNSWYAQALYKFQPNWRAGYRYSELRPKKNTPPQFAGTLLDSKGHKPEIHSAMIEWNNSEFSRIRFQYNYDKSDLKPDNQFILQYTMSFGAHGAHSF